MYMRVLRILPKPRILLYDLLPSTASFTAIGAKHKSTVPVLTLQIAFNMLTQFANACLVGFSMVAAACLWKSRKEKELLISKLKEKDAALINLQRELKPVNAVYGFVALERLEERITYQIRYITMALESIPKYYSSNAKLQRELERLQALDLEIEEAKRAYAWEFELSDQHRSYRSQKSALTSRLLRDTPSDQCPLEEFLHISPIESTFWSNGSKSQKRKLEKEYLKLKNIYPDISETKLRTTMVYVYTHFKRDIFALNSRRIERMARKLMMEDEELENSGNYEEAELCSICLEEMYSDEIINLTCNHLFHPDCIRPWLERDDRCPMCRLPQARNA